MGWFSNSKQPKSENDLVIAALKKSLAVIEFEPNGTVITANNNFLDMMGYRLEELQGRNHSVFIANETQENQSEAIWQRVKSGEPINGEFSFLANDEKIVWLQANYSPVIDEQGNVTKIVLLASDITALKKETVDATSKVQAINRSQAVIEFNLDGIIITANDNFLATVG
ncbi:MAG: PAS domain-containing protein, partial [Pseudoalteromonas sp.]